MSRTKKGGKGPGFDLGRKEDADYTWLEKPGRFSKKKTNRHQRRKAKRQLRDNYEA